MHHLSEKSGDTLNQLSTPRHLYRCGQLSLLRAVHRMDVGRARRFLHTKKNPASRNDIAVAVVGKPDAKHVVIKPIRRVLSPPLRWQATRLALPCNPPARPCDIVDSPTNHAELEFGLAKSGDDDGHQTEGSRRSGSNR